MSGREAGQPGLVVGRMQQVTACGPLGSVEHGVGVLAGDMFGKKNDAIQHEDVHEKVHIERGTRGEEEHQGKRENDPNGEREELLHVVCYMWGLFFTTET